MLTVYYLLMYFSTTNYCIKSFNVSLYGTVSYIVNRQRETHRVNHQRTRAPCNWVSRWLDANARGQLRRRVIIKCRDEMRVLYLSCNLPTIKPLSLCFSIRTFSISVLSESGVMATGCAYTDCCSFVPVHSSVNTFYSFYIFLPLYLYLSLCSFLGTLSLYL